jgi:hypothetical protein
MSEDIPDDHYEFDDPEVSFQASLALKLREYASPLTVHDFYRAIRSVTEIRDRENKAWLDRIDAEPRASEADRREARRVLKKNITEPGNRHRGKLEKELNRIERMPKDKRAAALKALEDAYRGQSNMAGRAPGTFLTSVNPKEVVSRGLSQVGSLPITLKHLDHLETGGYETSEYEPVPAADISGSMGQWNISAKERFVGTRGESPQELQAVVADMADRRKGIGPRARMLAEILQTIWKERHNDANDASVHIDEVAEKMGYERREANGLFPSEVYAEIREASQIVFGLESRWNAPPLKNRFGGSEGVGMTYVPITIYTVAGEAPADTPERVGKPLDAWTAIKFRLNDLFASTMTMPKPLLMGRDFDLNKLNLSHHRDAWSLGKQLENQFFYDWDRGRGVISRKIGWLLDAAGITSGKPMESLDRLQRAIKALQDEVSLVKQWSMPEEWRSAIERHADGKRMTPTRWLVLRDALVEIEASGTFRAHYASWKQVGQDKQDELRDALHELLATTDHSQVVIAKEIDVDPTTLSRFLSGRKNLSASKRERLAEHLAKLGRPIQGSLL